MPGEDGLALAIAAKPHTAAAAATGAAIGVVGAIVLELVGLGSLLHGKPRQKGDT